ncbi:mechanosensitive ion channel [Magnetospira thiophila]
MNDLISQLKELITWLEANSGIFLAYAPRMVGAVLFLIVGWFGSRMISRLTRRLLGAVNRLLDQKWRSGLGADIRLSETVIGISGTIAYWTLLLLVLIGTSRILGLEVFSDWLARILAHIPAVLGAAIVVFVGFVISQFVREVVMAALRPVMGARAQALASLSQTMVVVAALVVGLGQAGIDTTLLVSMVTILMAGLFGGMALAFGFGARDLVANLLGSHHLRASVSVGQQVRVGELQGSVIHTSPTNITIAIEGGSAVIPGAMFQREPVLILDDEGDADD